MGLFKFLLLFLTVATTAILLTWAVNSYPEGKPSAQPLQQQATDTHCQQGPKADKTCTPGAEFHPVTAKEICTPGWSAAHRNVPYSLKLTIYSEYGISSHSPGEYEIDHLIPLELGGNNDRTNLWPEKQPGASAKDEVENLLHAEVCSGQMSLRHSWSIIRRNYRQ